MRGDTVQIRLVGVNVDNRADGKGKAGLTFMTTTYVGEIGTNFAGVESNAGGYRDIRNRKDFNEGEYVGSISSDVYQYLTPVLKTQDNQAKGEMNNGSHSATSNAIVEKVSTPSPLELNMNVTHVGNGSYNGLTPTGLTQYNSNTFGGFWIGYYSYLYSGNAPYEYYQNNTSNVSEYCKLTRGNGLYDNSYPSCKGIPNKVDITIWLRSPGSHNKETFSMLNSGTGGNLEHLIGVSSDSYLNSLHVITLFSF